MPTADTADVKRENFATIKEALEGAGTTVLSRIDGDPIDRESRPTNEDLRKYFAENKKTVIGYGGPYTDTADERNSWTFAQEAIEEPVIPLTKQLLEEAEADRKKLEEQVAAMREAAK